MTSDYPRKYWWVILVIIPIVLALIQVYPDVVVRTGNGSGNGKQQVPPMPVLPPTPAPKPSVKEIVTYPSRISLQVGDTEALRVDSRDEQGRTLRDHSIDWKSSNNRIAIVSGSGRITAVAEGIALISAEGGGAMGATEVTVIPVPLAQIRVLPEKYSILAGGTFPLKAELRDAKGNLVDRPVNWHSKNTDVAYVTTTGVVKGFRFGIVEIVAEREGIEGRAKLFIGNAQTGKYPIEGLIVNKQ